VCMTTDTLLVSIFPLPDVSAGADRLLCEGESFLLPYPANMEAYVEPVNWMSEQEDGLLTITPTSSGSLILNVENSFGCLASDELQIELSPLPDVDFAVFPLVGCPPLTLDLINESMNPAGTSYYWSVGTAVYADDTSLILEEAGIYDVELHATSEFGCQNSETLFSAVEVWPAPVASFEILPEEPTAYTDEIQVINTGNFQSSTSWYLNDELVSNLFQPEFEIPIIEDFAYNVCQKVVNSFQCQDSVCQRVVILGDFTLYVPNAFTPNSDGRNELFIPVIRGLDVAHYDFQIYNRWGEMIFETSNPADGWYGNVKGGDHYAEPGIYVWQLKIRNKYTDNDILERGSVTLIR